MPSFLNMWRRKPIIQMDIPELGRAMSDEKSVDPEYQKKEVASDQRLQLNRREEYLKIPLSRVDDLLNLFGEQVILQSSLDHATESGKELDASYVRQTVSTLKKITQELQHNMDGRYLRRQQTVKLTSTARSGRSQSLVLAIYDDLSDKVRYVKLKPGGSMIYSFRGMNTIQIVPKLTAKNTNLNQARLKVESNRPLGVGH